MSTIFLITLVHATDDTMVQDLKSFFGLNPQEPNGIPSILLDAEGSPFLHIVRCEEGAGAANLPTQDIVESLLSPKGLSPEPLRPYAVLLHQQRQGFDYSWVLTKLLCFSLERDIPRLAQELVCAYWRGQPKLLQEILSKAQHSATQANADTKEKPPHFFLELLQNADDAGAKNVQFCCSGLTSGSNMIVYNDGDPFSFENMASITSIHNSSKTGANDKTGEKGIGFRSLLLRTDFVDVFSGGFQFRLSGLGDVHSMLPEWVEKPGLSDLCHVAHDQTQWNTRFFASGIKVDLNITLFVDDFRFLRNVTRVSIHVDGKSANVEIKKSKGHVLLIDLDGRLKAVDGESDLVPPYLHYEKISLCEAVSHRFHRFRFTLPVPTDKTRRGVMVEKTEISFDFPDVFSEDCRLYAYLPFETQRLFKRIHVNANFLADLGREKLADSIDGGKLWNDFLLSEIPALLVKCFEMAKLFSDSVGAYFPSKFLGYLPRGKEEMARDVKTAFLHVPCIKMANGRWVTPENPTSGEKKHFVVLETTLEQDVIGPFRVSLQGFVFPDPEMEGFSQTRDALKVLAGAKTVSDVLYDLVSVICESDEHKNPWVDEKWYCDLFELLNVHEKKPDFSSKICELKLVQTSGGGRCTLSDPNLVFDNHSDIFDLFKLALKDLKLAILPKLASWKRLFTPPARNTLWLRLLKQVPNSVEEKFWTRHQKECPFSGHTDLMEWFKTIKWDNLLRKEFYKYLVARCNASAFKNQQLFYHKKTDAWILGSKLHYCEDDQWATLAADLALGIDVWEEPWRGVFNANYLKGLGFQELEKRVLEKKIVACLWSPQLEPMRHVQLVRALAKLDTTLDGQDFDDLMFYCIDQREKPEKRKKRSVLVGADKKFVEDCLDNRAKESAFFVDLMRYNNGGNDSVCTDWFEQLFKSERAMRSRTASRVELIAKCENLSDAALEYMKQITIQPEDLLGWDWRTHFKNQTYKIENVSGRFVFCRDLIDLLALKIFGDPACDEKVPTAIQELKSKKELPSELSAALGIKHALTESDFERLIHASWNETKSNEEARWAEYRYIIRRVFLWIKDHDKLSAEKRGVVAANPVTVSFVFTPPFFSSQRIFLCPDGALRNASEIAWGLDEEERRLLPELHRFSLDEYWVDQKEMGQKDDIMAFFFRVCLPRGMTDVKWHQVLLELPDWSFENRGDQKGREAHVQRWWWIVQKLVRPISPFPCPVTSGGWETPSKTNTLFYPNDLTLAESVKAKKLILVQLPNFVREEADGPRIKGLFNAIGCKILTVGLMPKFQVPNDDDTRPCDIWQKLKELVKQCLVTDGQKTGTPTVGEVDSVVECIQVKTCREISVSYTLGNESICTEKRGFFDDGGKTIYVIDGLHLSDGLPSYLGRLRPAWKLVKLTKMLEKCLSKDDDDQVPDLNLIERRATKFAERGLVSAESITKESKNRSKQTGATPPVTPMRRTNLGESMTRSVGERGHSMDGPEGSPRAGETFSFGEGVDDDGTEEEFDSWDELEDQEPPCSISTINISERAALQKGRKTGHNEQNDLNIPTSRDGVEESLGADLITKGEPRRTSENPREYASDSAEVGKKAEQLVFTFLRSHPKRLLSRIIGKSVTSTSTQSESDTEFTFSLEGGGTGCCRWVQKTADVQIYMGDEPLATYFVEVKGSMSNKGFHLTSNQWSMAQLKGDKFFVVYLPRLELKSMVVIQDFYGYVMNHRKVSVSRNQVEGTQIGVIYSGKETQGFYNAKAEHEPLI